MACHFDKSSELIEKKLPLEPPTAHSQGICAPRIPHHRSVLRDASRAPAFKRMGLCMPTLLTDFVLFSGVVLLATGIVMAVAGLLS